MVPLRGKLFGKRKCDDFKRECVQFEMTGKSLQWDYPLSSWDNEIEMGGVSSGMDIYT